MRMKYFTCWISIINSEIKIKIRKLFFFIFIRKYIKSHFSESRNLHRVYNLNLTYAEKLNVDKSKLWEIIVNINVPLLEKKNFSFISIIYLSPPNIVNTGKRLKILENFEKFWKKYFVAILATFWQALEKFEKNILLPFWQHFGQRLKMLGKFGLGGVVEGWVFAPKGWFFV